MTLTNETFITKAKTIHGDRYDYSLVVYTASKNKVSIICPIHGVFEQEANSHINKGHGCKSCSAMVEGINRTLAAKEQFVSRANLLHNNKYDYSLVEYTGNRYKIKIVCKQHGEFLQRPQDHLQGSGCAHCSREEAGFTKTKFKEKCTNNNNGLGILYVLECFNDNEKFYKIGITSNSVKKRYNSKTLMPYAYSVVKEIVGDGAYIYDLETKLHQLNKENKYVPSISFAGCATECFSKYKEIA